jgi:hypothetical protein
MHHEWSTSIGVNLKSLENIVATLQTDVKPTLLPSLPCLQEIPDENLSDWEPPIFETKYTAARARLATTNTGIQR